MNNLNLIFNKLYYERLGKEDFDKSVQNKNKEIFSSVFNHDTDYKKSEIANETFIMKTTYPGLLVGQSKHHGSGKYEEDISTGMDLDFVTGQPYISSTTVKGVLHACFKYKKKATIEIIRALTGKEFTPETLEALEKEIFVGNDIFLDAVVYDGDEYGRLVGKDYFAPQKNSLKSPILLLMIKVLPNVRFEFRFILSDGILSREEKRSVFSEIISLFGIGGRTNVGYGKMEHCGEEIGEKKKYAEMLPKNMRQEYIVCPKCGATNCKYKMNFEYRYITDEVNPNWEEGICFKPDCGGKFR